MVTIPAVCDNCNNIFPSGFAGGPGGTMTFVNSKSGPCPNCGQMGSIINGTYKIIDEAIAVINSSDKTMEELKSIFSYLNRSTQEVQGGTSEEQFEEKIQNESPEAYSLLQLILPQNREEQRGNLFFIVATILGVLQVIIGMSASEGTENPQEIHHHHYEIESDEVIEEVYNSPAYKQQPTTPTQDPVRSEKIGRNEPCPCGSGVKYKKCHGAP